MQQRLFIKVSNSQKVVVLIFHILFFCSNYAFSLQLGDGTNKNQMSPVEIMTNVLQAVGGASHTLIVTQNGDLWAVGSNDFGQLGIGTTVDSDSPKKVMDNVVAVSAGGNSSLALRSDGSLWIFGAVPVGIEKANNKFDSDRIKWGAAKSPVVLDKDVLFMSVGTRNFLYVKKDKSLWGMGDNLHANLGDGTTYPKLRPQKIRDNVAAVFSGKLGTLILDEAQNLYVSGSVYEGTVIDKNGPFLIFEKIASNVIAMTEGLYITSDNNLWGFGFAAYGNLGLGKIGKSVPPTIVMSDVISVASSGSHTLILRSDGSLLTCGGGPNMFGALGDGRNEPQYVPTLIMNDVRAIAVGDSHSLVVKNNNSLWAFGLNSKSLLR